MQIYSFAEKKHALEHVVILALKDRIDFLNHKELHEHIHTPATIALKQILLFSVGIRGGNFVA